MPRCLSENPRVILDVSSLFLTPFSSLWGWLTRSLKQTAILDSMPSATRWPTLPLFLSGTASDNWSSCFLQAVSLCFKNTNPIMLLLLLNTCSGFSLSITLFIVLTALNSRNFLLVPCLPLPAGVAGPCVSVLHHHGLGPSLG